MVDSNVDEFLAHYGKVGMHWGRRKTSSGSDSASPIGTSHRSTSEDHNAAQALQGRKLSSMSNAEIKTLNNRMNLEVSYRTLHKKPKSKGEKFIEKLLDHAGTGQKLFNLANSPMVAAGMDAMGPQYAPKHAKGIKAVVGSGHIKDAYKPKH